MEVKEALLKRRTIRKFKQTPIEEEKLKGLINYARLSPFAANIQGLKYKIITEKSLNNKIFDNVKWAGYLPDGAPTEGERPVSYIAILGDTTIKQSFETDAGTAVFAIILGAWDMGIGSCWMGSVDRKNIAEILELDEKYSLLYIIALGYPLEESKECEYIDNPKYYYDEKGTLNVPKRSLEDIII